MTRRRRFTLFAAVLALPIMTWFFSERAVQNYMVEQLPGLERHTQDLLAKTRLSDSIRVSAVRAGECPQEAVDKPISGPILLYHARTSRTTPSEPPPWETLRIRVAWDYAIPAPTGLAGHLAGLVDGGDFSRVVGSLVEWRLKRAVQKVNGDLSLVSTGSREWRVQLPSSATNTFRAEIVPRPHNVLEFNLSSARAIGLWFSYDSEVGYYVGKDRLGRNRDTTGVGYSGGAYVCVRSWPDLEILGIRRFSRQPPRHTTIRGNISMRNDAVQAMEEWLQESISSTAQHEMHDPVHFIQTHLSEDEPEFHEQPVEWRYVIRSPN